MTDYNDIYGEEARAEWEALERLGKMKREYKERYANYWRTAASLAVGVAVYLLTMWVCGELK